VQQRPKQQLAWRDVKPAEALDKQTRRMGSWILSTTRKARIQRRPTQPGIAERETISKELPQLSLPGSW
jgi:hypothetical protein